MLQTFFFLVLTIAHAGEPIGVMDWRAMQHMSAPAFKDRWTASPKLKEWHWSWRLAWLRRCYREEVSLLSICDDIFAQAAVDPAAVVRRNFAENAPRRAAVALRQCRDYQAKGSVGKRAQKEIRARLLNDSRL